MNKRNNKFVKSCKICKNRKLKFAYQHDKKNYYVCIRCNFIFQNPMPSLNELKVYYSKKYFNENYFNKNRELNLRNKQYSLDKQILIKHFKDNKNKKILDYGCGNGNFLAKFKAKKFGFEFNKNAKLNKKIKKLSSVNIKKEKYDLIIMRGVIEHIPNFDVVVKELCKCLKKGGFFYITATPNTNNLTFLLSPKDFNQNDVRHIYHFNNVNLSMFFLQNNLFNIETVYQYANTPYAKYLSDFKFSKTQLRNFVSVNNRKSKSPPGVGNMITSVFKKMI
tara:strand:- start:196 stop:1029 length:834 start_codon:yes stop_codon:yes gene_type:complete